MVLSIIKHYNLIIIVLPIVIWQNEQIDLLWVIRVQWHETWYWAILVNGFHKCRFYQPVIHLLPDKYGSNFAGDDLDSIDLSGNFH